MQSFAPSHPQQGALYFKVTDAKTKKSVACIWDIESHTGGDMRVINFSKGCDYMIHDTQYTDEEYYSNKMIVQGFGHSTYNMAVENAAKAGVGTLIPFHYNPNHTDEKLDEIFNNMKDKSVLRFMAKEGMTVEI
jgi:ribonuclease BN (tRNA processing enzyme)